MLCCALAPCLLAHSATSISTYHLVAWWPGRSDGAGCWGGGGGMTLTGEVLQRASPFEEHWADR